MEGRGNSRPFSYSAKIFGECKRPPCQKFDVLQNLQGVEYTVLCIVEPAGAIYFGCKLGRRQVRLPTGLSRIMENSRYWRT